MKILFTALLALIPLVSFAASDDVYQQEQELNRMQRQDIEDQRRIAADIREEHRQDEARQREMQHDQDAMQRESESSQRSDDDFSRDIDNMMRDSY